MNEIAYARLGLLRIVTIAEPNGLHVTTAWLGKRSRTIGIKRERRDALRDHARALCAAMDLENAPSESSSLSDILGHFMAHICRGSFLR